MSTWDEKLFFSILTTVIHLYNFYDISNAYQGSADQNQSVLEASPVHD